MFSNIIKKHKIQFGIVSLMSVFSSMTYVYAGYSLSFLVSAYDSDMQINVLFKNGTRVFGIWIIALFFLYIYSVYQQRLLCLMRTDLRELMAQKIITQKYNEFIEKDTGNYVSWMTNDVEQISKQVFSNFFSILDSLVQAVFSLVALFYLGIWIGVSAIILFFIISIIPQIASKGLESRTTALSSAQENATEKFKENINGYNIFYISNKRQYFLKKINSISKKLEDKQYLYEKEAVLLNVLSATVSLLGQIVMILVTVAMAITGFTPLGAILSVGNLGQTFFSNVASSIECIVAANASKKIWKKYEIDTNNIKKKTLKNKVSSIRINELSYSYDEKTIIENISLVFEKGKKYAITGESGSGKTTLGKIIAGFLDDYSGNVLFDKVEVKDINIEELYNTITYVDQQVFIFGESIRNNITLGDEYTDDEIWNVLERCNLYDYVNSLEDGLDHIIKENGKNLSGGQKQRIALARAILRKVDYIIIDEGTSALDIKNASEIENTLLNDPAICLILISHHLSESTLEKMDSIYNIEIKK